MQMSAGFLMYRVVGCDNLAEALATVDAFIDNFRAPNKAVRVFP